MTGNRVDRVRRLLYRNTGHAHEKMVKRMRPVTMSTESIDFKATHSAKTTQAWKYPGGKVVRAASTWLGSKDYYDHKDIEQKLPRRKQESNFFITINTNLSANAVGVAKTLESVLTDIAAEQTLATYLTFGPKHDEYTNDKYQDVVHSVSWSSNVEVGDVAKRVHAHIWLTVTHYSQIQIDVRSLMHTVKTTYAKHSPGAPLRRLPYVHVKLLPQSDWTSVMRQYIHKAMTHV